MKKTTSLLVAAVAAASFSTVTSAPANAALYYGAIAYSGNGASGTAYNYSSRSEAETLAELVCGYTDCDTLTSFTGCGAVARNSTQAYGGSGPTLAAAQRKALASLRSSSGPGYIDAWACNKGS
ncbi:DUF4189 domain-containing protein [Mycobacterium sp. NPDC050041]|uniref:DUF4189 domain-containing protein n=1 Tax=Mycobacterium sp. NPDC050041 TaxID=3364293 RepID=UPI003C2CC4C9